MNIKTFDDALDFLPGRPHRANGVRRLIGILAKTAKGIDQGRTAHANYKRHTARGLAPAEAARKVLAEDLGA